MYVCICNAVTDSDIIEAQKNGLTTLKDITRNLGVGNCCGRCVTSAKSVLEANAGVQTFTPTVATEAGLISA